MIWFLWFIFSLEISTSVAYKICWVKGHHDIDDFFSQRKYHKVLCSDEDICCEEGCCQIQNTYDYTWEILLTALLICISVAICVYGCYYCKTNCTRRKIINSSSSNSNQTQNGRTVMPPLPSCPPRLSDSPPNYRTPPPPYDVAVALPPNPNVRIPTYEEVASSKKVFSLT